MGVFPFQFKREQGYCLGCILSILFMVGLVPKARAFLPNSQNEPLNLSNRKLHPNTLKGKYEGPSQMKLRGLLDENKPEWIGLWNSWGTIHRLYAPRQYKTTRLRGTEVTDEEIRSIALRYIEEYSRYFKVDPEDLILEEIINRGGIFYCRFKQLYKGINIYGGGIQFRFDETGSLLLIGGDTYPGITISPYPSISKKEAEGIARQELGAFDGKKRIGDMELFVLPMPLGNELEYVLVWQVPVFADSTGRSTLIFVDANNGEIILAYRLDRPAITGRIGGLILPEYFNDSPQWVPFSNQSVYLLNHDLPVYENNLDADPGWRREGMWEFGDPVPQDIYLYGHAGCPDPNSGYTSQNVLGYNLTGDYTNLMRPKYLTTDTLNCTNKTGITLTFWRWLGVHREYWETDEGDRTDYDTATVEVSNDSGLTWTVIWANGTSQIEDGVYDGFQHIWKGWNLQFFDISELADGKDIVVRWGMGPTDGSGTFCGWNLDDIGLYESLDTLTDPNGFFAFPDTGGVSDNTLISLLSGSHINVINEDGSSAIYRIDDISSNPNYPIAVNWDTNQTSINELDELNVFYHINTLLNYVKQIDPLYNAIDEEGPIKVIVRYGDNYKNAFWSPQHMICFGEGDSRPDGYRNFALFSDIVFHEYMHAITDSFYSFFMPPLTSVRKATSGEQTGPVFVTEFDAMHEAFSDYWACTMNDDSMVGEGDFWIGHNYVRNLDNEFKYPDDYGDDAYANSLILSGAMWEARELLGKDITDPLFHLARYGGATTFEDFLIDVLLQDEISFNGDHVELLKNIFGLRGISRAPTAPNSLVAQAGDTYINLEWKENPDIDEIEGYYVYFRTENDIASDREDPSVRRDAGLITSYRLEGLTNGTTYVLKVSAYNEYRAESDPSDLVYATPYLDSLQTALGSDRKAFCFLGALSY
jgi:hypothetical protein